MWWWWWVFVSFCFCVPDFFFGIYISFYVIIRNGIGYAKRYFDQTERMNEEKSRQSAEERMVVNYANKKQLPREFEESIKAFGILFRSDDGDYVLLPEDFSIEMGERNQLLLRSKERGVAMRFRFHIKEDHNDYWEAFINFRALLFPP